VPRTRIEDAPARARSQARWFLVLLVGLFLTSRTQLPWRMAGLPLAAAALVSGSRLLGTQATLRRSGRAAPGFLAVAVGLGLVALALFQLLAEAAVYPVAADLERCTARASTLQASAECEREFERRLAEITSRLTSR
jgi:hypothetical protein